MSKKADVKIEKMHNLLPLQEGMLFYSVLDKKSQNYLLQNTTKITGELETVILEKSIQLLALKHDVLRSIVAYSKVKNPIMIIVKDRVPEFVSIDLSNCENAEIKLDQIKEEDLRRGFDFEKDTLFRVKLVKIKESSYRMIWSLHHIILDGWSISILMNDFKKIYSELSQGTSGEILSEKILKEKKTRCDFESFVKWHRAQNHKEGFAYWKKLLKDYYEAASIEPLGIATQTNAQVSESRIRIQGEQYRALVHCARECNVTLNTVIETAVGFLIQQYACSDDVVFGKVVSGRNADIKNIDSIVGLLINTIPVRVSMQEDMTVKDLIHEMQIQALESNKYDYCDLAEIEQQTVLKNNLIKVLFAFENYYEDDNYAQNYGEVEFQLIDEREQTNYDILISAYEERGLVLNLQYNPEKYSAFEAEHILETLHIIIDVFAENVNRKLSDIRVISREDQERIRNQFNDTKMELPTNWTVIDRLEQFAKENPGKIGLKFKNEQMTYKEFNEKVNVIANKLRELGVTRNIPVVMFAERSMEMIIGIYGILKAGGAYVPIDPTYPEERIRYILQDCKPAAIITYGADITADVPKMDLSDSAIWDGNRENPEKVNTLADMIYIIYTSGTTGKPKGVPNIHQGLFNLLMWMQQRYTLTESDVILMKTTYVFDVSASEIFWWSFAGVTLAIAAPGEEKDPLALADFIEMMQVSVIDFVPSMLSVFLATLENKENYLRKLKSLRYIIAAGEALNTVLANQFNQIVDKKQLRVKLVNLYGPTEACIYTTYYDCKKENAMIPIGKPIGNVQVYILHNNNLCGIAQKGELCIAGKGLAIGYLNNEELTKKKFINNPFGEGKLYRTGDLARWMADGNIEYCGRMDEQVKIRGFRIELGEIENVLRNIEYVNEAAVIVRENTNGEKEICAYAVANRAISIKEIMYELGKELPYYMLPTYMMQIEQLPLTRNGKLDRNALPQIKVSSEKQYKGPRTGIEKKIVEIFQEVLDLEKVGIEDNFFEIGGHSLRATRIVNRVEAATGVRILLKDVFAYPTVEGLARLVMEEASEEYFPIPKAEKKETYPMSSAQKRIFLISEIGEDNSLNYNMPQVMRVTGNVDVEKLKEAFEQLILHHEILRTEFFLQDGVPVQRVVDEAEGQFQYIEDAVTEEKELIKAQIRSFDLAKASQIRLILIKREEDYILILDIHHIICDGMSLENILHEMERCYNGEKVEAQTLQYKDYSEWMRERDLSPQKKYWVKQFENEIPVSNLPTDFPRQQKQSFSGGVIQEAIGKELAKKIRKRSKEYGVTEYMILLSAVMILVGKYGRQEDVVIGSPISARTHQDTEQMLGMFVNTLALRARPEGQKQYIDFLEEIRECCLKAYENQEYPFEELVEELRLARDMARNPLFDIMFVMQNNEEKKIKFHDMNIKEILYDLKVSKFDLTFQVEMRDDQYVIALEYCADLFRKSSIQRMLTHYISILEQIMDQRDLRLDDIQMITSAEKEQIVHEFNATDGIYPADKTISELFDAQIKKQANRNAIVFEEKAITYTKLGQDVNHIAMELRKIGIKPNDFVAIIAEKSIEMVEGIYGVLKAGGAYVPIDYTYPAKRIRYIIDDCQPKAVIVHGNFNKTELLYFLEGQVPVIEINDLINKVPMMENFSGVNHPNDLAYCIYTSGTTGSPKGVMLEHRGIANLKAHFEQQLGITSQDRILQFANYVFDASVWEMSMALLTGATMVMVSQEVIGDMVRFEAYCKEKQVSVATLPPNYYVQTNHLKLRLLITAGSESSKLIAEKAKDFTYVNAYGPTETTVCATYWMHKKGEAIDSVIPIGNPIINTNVYVMDKGRLCGIGVPGELCISGVGIARGYRNLPELTRKKFTECPFGKGKLYQSGDLVRWLEDGTIEYLGRIDQQVKIRGYRIELGEVENVIRQVAYIKDVAAIVSEDTMHNKCICAYVVSDETVSVEELRKEIGNSLPEYMLPSYFLQINAIPITRSGKVDTKALPEIQIKNLREYIAPQNEVQKILCEIFEQVLQVEQIGIFDNFFELGGDSIKAIQIISKLRTYQMTLTIKDVLAGKTVCYIAQRVKREEIESYSQEEYCGYVAPTPIQKAFLTKWNLKNPNHFNQTMVIKMIRFKREAVHAALKELVIHHDILRVIIKEGKLYVPSSKNAKLYELIELDGSGCEHIYDNEFVRNECCKIQSSMTLSEGPLVKAVIITTRTEEHLVFCLHHLVVDSVSWRIILEDFESGYLQFLQKGAIELPEKTASSDAWAKALEEYRQSPKLKKEIPYWKEISEQAKECRFEDASGKGNETAEGMRITSISFGTSYTDDLLHHINVKYNTDLNDIFLACLAQTGKTLTGNSKFVVSLEGHGRQEIHKKMDLSRTVGWFTITYPVIISAEDNYEETIIMVKESLRKIPNKGIGYSLLQNEKKLLDTDCVDLSFNYLGQIVGSEQSDGVFESSDLFPGEDISEKNKLPGDFLLILYFIGDELQCNIMYNSKRYSDIFVQKFCSIFRRVLEEVITFLLGQTETTQTLSDIDAKDVEQDEMDKLNSLIDSLF